MLIKHFFNILKMREHWIGINIRSILCEFQRQYLDICTQIYLTTYVPFCSATFRHLHDSIYPKPVIFLGLETGLNVFFFTCSREFKILPVKRIL